MERIEQVLVFAAPPDEPPLPPDPEGAAPVTVFVTVGPGTFMVFVLVTVGAGAGVAVSVAVAVAVTVTVTVGAGLALAAATFTASSCPDSEQPAAPRARRAIPPIQNCLRRLSTLGMKAPHTSRHTPLRVE
ncbi:hypothetical protein GCM10010527_55170 [Streptomyces drozdowiczii]